MVPRLLLAGVLSDLCLQTATHAQSMEYIKTANSSECERVIMCVHAEGCVCRQGTEPARAFGDENRRALHFGNVCLGLGAYLIGF